MKENQIDIITLGCSKNLVDSERLIRKLEGNGYHCTHDTKRPNGDIAIINTCGFIGDAKEESINTILEFVQAKEEGRLKKLLVMGCLSQRYKNDLVKEIPQVDKYYGKFDFKQVVEDLGKAKSSVKSAPAKLTPHHYAYIKISEGCNRHCAYCAIPIITGSHKSRSMDDILDEIRRYVDNGVYEFQIIAQELTYYGIDFDGKSHIAELIEKISDIKIAVNYSVDKQKASILYREIGKDFKGVIIEPAIYETMKSSIANYTAEQLVTKRQEVSNLAQNTLTSKLKDKGINITALNITDLSFSKEFDEAIEKKQIVEQQTQQAKYELEKAKVENEKKIENAKAEAEVMKQQNKEITDKTLELKRLEVQEKLINKWNGALPSTTLGNNIPMLNIGK